MITYRDFVARVTQAANMFHALGVGKDDVVSFMLPLVPDAFVTLFGAEAAGIANPVNPLLEPHQIAEILEAAKTKVLVALGPMPGTDIWQKVEQIRPQLKHLKAIVQVFGGGDPAKGIYRLRRPDQAAAGRPAGQRPQDLGGRHRRLFPHRRHHRHAEARAPHPRQPGLSGLGAQSAAEVEARRQLLFGMPLFHVGGSLTQALLTLSAGGCLVVLSPAGWRNPNAVKNIWGLVERFKPEVLSSVPTVLAATLAVPRGSADISSLRYAAGGGSAIPVAVGSAIQDKLKLPVVEVYGMTETSSVHTMAYPGPADSARLGRTSAALRARAHRAARCRRPPAARLRGGRDRRRDHGRPRRVRRLSQ